MTRLAKWLYIAGAGVTGVLMVALFMAGFFEIGKGVLTFFGLVPLASPDARLEASVMTLVLEGLEFLFLAPLAFLVFSSLGHYLEIRATSDGDRRAAIQDVVEVKRLVVSLMIAVIGTNLIERILSTDGLSYEAGLSASAVIAVLAAYLYILESGSSHSATSGKDAAPQQQSGEPLIVE